MRAWTAAGAGALSAASRPVLTERAPTLLREVRVAETTLDRLRGRLQRRNDELLTLARSGTMTLRLDGGSPTGDVSTVGASQSESAPATELQSPAVSDGDGGKRGGIGAATRGKSSPSRVSAVEARKAVRRRKRLEQQVDELEELIASQSIKVATLQANQAGADAARREALAEAAGFVGVDSSAELGPPWGEGATGSPTAGTLRSVLGSMGGLSPSPGSPSSPVAMPRASLAGVASAARQRRLADPSRLQRLEAYARLFAEDEARVVETYAPFQRELVRLQLEQVMAQHVMQNGGAEMSAYFNLCLNRARSAETHNVFDRFADWELEQLVLLFGRFDTDHDGVLEFNDFCRVMLMIGERVGAAYHEKQLLRMFKKVDLTGDKLIDLNEFLWMQVPPEKLAEGAEEGVHPRPPEELTRRRSSEARHSGGLLDAFEASSIATSLDSWMESGSLAPSRGGSSAADDDGSRRDGSSANAPRTSANSPRASAYSPRASAYSPRASAYSPRASAYSPRASAYSPRASAYSPRASAYSPRASAYSPRASAYSPRASAYSPRASAYSPRASAYSPRASAYSPRASAYSPRASAYSPRASDSSKNDVYREGLHDDDEDDDMSCSSFEARGRGIDERLGHALDAMSTSSSIDSHKV